MSKFAWVQPSLWGAAAGAIALAVVGFSWGGWVSGNTSKQNAEILAQSRLVTAMTPYCVAKSQADPQSAERMVALKAAAQYDRRELVMKNGWATAEGAKEADRAVADQCQKALTT